MSGIESLVQQGMELGTRAFADGGFVTINTAEGPMAVPIFNRSDWEWVDPDGRPGGLIPDPNYQYTGGDYDTGPRMVTSDAWGGGWKMTEAARARLAPVMSMFQNPNNYAWNPAYSNGQMQYGTANPLEFGNQWDPGQWDSYDGNMTYRGGATWRNDVTKDMDPLDFIKQLMIKDSRSTVQGINYAKVGDQIVPMLGERGNWITNTGESNRIALASFASLIAAGYAIPYIAAELGMAIPEVASAVESGVASGAIPAEAAANAGLNVASYLPEAAGAVTGAEGYAPLYGGLTAGEAAAGGATAGIGTLGGPGVEVMPPITITPPAAAAPLPAWVAPVAGAGASAGLGSLPDGAPGEGGPSIDQTQQPYTPEEGPYAPGEAPGTINAPAPAPFDWWEWVKTHPRELISGIGTIGSIIDDNTGSSGSGGSGGGGSGTGWNGPISNFSANQTYTPAPENYRPGFSPEHVYMRTSYTPGNPREPMMNQGVAAALPAPPPNIPPLDPYGGGYIAIDPSSAFPEARAGIGALPKTKAVEFAGGGMTKGPGDGMSDHIPATIEGQQPAVLSAEEFVVPADVVSHLGNGSSEAGAKVLYAMMDRIRQARTGSKSQAREIDPAKFLP